MDLSRYRANVGIVLARADGKVWLGRRADVAGPRNWQFPQGGVDDGEGAHEAALRELHEETGVTSVSLLARTEEWFAYDFPEGHRGAKRAKGWIGQKQLWFAFRFLGDESEIDLSGHHHVEFDAWRWAELAEAPEQVAVFKEVVYRRVVDAFASVIRPS
jgi:putative (di)nucleoside polyphosphate hydrolase